MMKEVTKQQLKKKLTDNEDVLIVYFYTPLCGTCAASERMLSIVLQAIPSEITSTSCNVNYINELAGQLQIESVPCLMIFKENELKEKVYAFRSVDYLYRLIKPYSIK